MKIYRIVRSQMAILGFCPNQSLQSHPFNGRIAIGFIIQGVSLTLELVYFFQGTHSLMEYSQSFYTIGVTSIISIPFVISSFKMEKLFEFIVTIENLCDGMGNSKLIKKTNAQVEKYSTVVLLLMTKIMPISAMLPKSIASFYIYFTTKMGRDAFELPIPLWFPFDWESPLRYLMVVIFEFLDFTYILYSAAILVCFGFVSFFFAIMFAKRVIVMLKEFGEAAKTKGNPATSWHLKQLSDYIEFHSGVKQAIDDFNGIFQPIFMITLTWSIVTICGTMLMIQTSYHENDLAVLFVSISNMLYAFGLVSFICELGQRITNAFETVEHTIEAFDWYLFPIELQRKLPMILCDAQQPVALECFGSISCNRVSFKKVTNKGYSYFTVLKHLD